MRLVAIILVFIICATSIPAKCQYDIIKGAYTSYQNGNLTEARTYVDSAMTFPSLTKDPSTWYLRGFVYKDLFKLQQGNNSLRKEAIQSFQALLEMDDIDKYEQDAIQNIKFLASTYYNDAVVFLNQQDLVQAIEYYQYFTSNYPYERDTSFNLIERNKEFYLAIGSTYTTLHNVDTSGNDQNFEQAITHFKKVLEFDSLNLKANYNLGVLYYNKALSVIADLDYEDVDIIAISELEDKSIKMFEISLPYFLLAYQINPRDINTLEGLAGIYFSLRDFETSNKFKSKVAELSK